VFRVVNAETNSKLYYGLHSTVEQYHDALTIC